MSLLLGRDLAQALDYLTTKDRILVSGVQSLILKEKIDT